MKNEKPPWFKARNYLHFDRAIKSSLAEKIVTNPDRVKSHSFYPFISYKNTTERVYNDSGVIRPKLKLRTISYASHIDSSIYSYYSHLLSISYERHLKDRELQSNITAFRALNKSNIDFAYDIFSEIRKRKSCSAIALDITGFFDNLDHQYLKKMWSKNIVRDKLPHDHYSVFKSITQYSYVDRDELYEELKISKNNPKKDRSRICLPIEFRNKVRKRNLIEKNQGGCGIPQGSPISAILSNIYMIDFDESIKNYMNEIGGSYYRYCDDMMILAPLKYRESCVSYIRSEIKNINLLVNESKTKIANFSISSGKQKSDKKLQYLGFTFDGERILLRSAVLSRYSKKMKSGVKLAKCTQKKYNHIRTRRGNSEEKIYRKNLYKRYSHLGKRNFLTYGYRAAKKMESPNIKKQLKPLWRRLIQEIEK